jgi:hypothetical protein
MRKKGHHEPSTLQKEAKTRSIQGIRAYAGGTGSVIAPHPSGASTSTDRTPPKEDLLETRMKTLSRPSTIHSASTVWGTGLHGVGTHRSADTIPWAHGKGLHRPHDVNSSLPWVGRSPHHAGYLLMFRFAPRPDHVHAGHSTPAQQENHRSSPTRALPTPMPKSKATETPPSAGPQPSKKAVSAQPQTAHFDSTEPREPTHSPGISRSPTRSDAPLGIAYIRIRATQPTPTSPISQEVIRHIPGTAIRNKAPGGTRESHFPLAFAPQLQYLDVSLSLGTSPKPPPTKGKTPPVVI